MATLTQLVEGHTKNATNVLNMLGKMKAERDETQKKLDECILKERNYLRILNDFHKECVQNQELRDQMESHS